MNARRPLACVAAVGALLDGPVLAAALVAAVNAALAVALYVQARRLVTA